MILNEVKVNYTRQTGEDNPGKVREAYLVESISCSDAEKQVTDYLEPYIFGDFEAPQIRKRQFFDVFDNRSGEFFYESKVEIIIVDGDKETRKAVTVLVQENTLTGALEELKRKMETYDCEIISIKKSAILELLRPTK
ncbi:MAG: DUF4494 family protein [Paludibacteraceae bacterium]|nr:DUF4494 family protein [Paludibacteraceae bacterium]